MAARQDILALQEPWEEDSKQLDCCFREPRRLPVRAGGRRRRHKFSTRGPGHGRSPRSLVADRRCVAVPGTRQGRTAPPGLRGVSFFGSFAPVSLWALASPHTSTSWTPQGSFLARDRQECVTGPITPSIKGPFRLGPSASPDRAPFLEPGSNQADRPRGFSGHTWCFLFFPLCGVHDRNLSPTACWRCVPLAAPWAQWEKKTTRHMRQTGAGDQGMKEKQISSSLPRDFSSREWHVMVAKSAGKHDTLLLSLERS